MNLFMFREHVKEKSTDTQQEHTVEETLNYLKVHPVCGQSHKLVKYTHASTRAHTHTHEHDEGGVGAVWQQSSHISQTKWLTTLYLVLTPLVPSFSPRFFFSFVTISFLPLGLNPPRPHPTLIIFLHPFILFPSRSSRLCFLGPLIHPQGLAVNTLVCYSHYSSSPPSPNPFIRPPFFPFTPFPQRTLVSPSLLPPSFKVSFLWAVLFWFLHPSAQLTFSSITLMLDWLTFCLCFLSLLQSYYFFSYFSKTFLSSRSLSRTQIPPTSLLLHVSLSLSLSLCLYVFPSILPPTD